ncbi:MAG: glycogen/starch/alpha-glucan phosphorylase, partial [Clostridia bacterium]|nr:glycogen/starch/alpha-glucan phosphorylase [Clostridia bacterium]
YYKINARLKATVDRISCGFNGEDFTNIVNYFLGSGRIADPYMCLADFESYVKTDHTAVDDYSDRETWTKRSLLNIAAAGRFASDRSIGEYAENIWNLKPVKE